MTTPILDRIREASQVREASQRALQQGREDMRALIAEARAEGHTLKEIGDALGVSRQMVHQLSDGLAFVPKIHNQTGGVER